MATAKHLVQYTLRYVCMYVCNVQAYTGNVIVLEVSSDVFVLGCWTISHLWRGGVVCQWRRRKQFFQDGGNLWLNCCIHCAMNSISHALWEKWIHYTVVSILKVCGLAVLNVIIEDISWWSDRTLINWNIPSFPPSLPLPSLPWSLYLLWTRLILIM